MQQLRIGGLGILDNSNERLVDLVYGDEGLARRVRLREVSERHAGGRLEVGMRQLKPALQRLSHGTAQGIGPLKQGQS